MANYFQTFKIINGRLNKETLLLDDEYINENELLNCQSCSYEYDEPRLLPCGYSICNHCVFKIKNELKNDSEGFACSLCKSNHTFPSNGLFPIVRSILSIMNKNSQKNELQKLMDNELKLNLSKIEENINKIETKMQAGSDNIHYHCIELRRRVQLVTEEKILAINNISESLISRIDAYEKDTVNNYNGEKVRFNEIKQMKKCANEFIDETNPFLTGFKIHEKKVEEALVISHHILGNLSEEMKLFDSLVLNNKEMKFEVNNEKINDDILGTIEVEEFEDYYNFEDYEETDNETHSDDEAIDDEDLDETMNDEEQEIYNDEIEHIKLIMLFGSISDRTAI